jgi:hypothetical protein
LRDGAIADILAESTEHVEEALGLWSSGRLELQLPKVLAWCSALVQKVVFYDQCFSVFMQALLEHFPLPEETAAEKTTEATEAAKLSEEAGLWNNIIWKLYGS